MLRHVLLTGSILLVALLPAATIAQETAAPDHVKMTEVASSGLTWAELTPPGFKAGMSIAVLHGDPAVAGQAYTLRLKFVPGYEFPAHYHPSVENLTVLSGSFLLAEGTSEDRSLQKTYGPGDFMAIPANSPHYGGATEETVIQLHGIGPFDIILSNPAAASK